MRYVVLGRYVANITETGETRSGEWLTQTAATSCCVHARTTSGARAASRPRSQVGQGALRPPRFKFRTICASSSAQLDRLTTR